MASGQDMFQPRSLVEILSFLRDLDVDPARVRSQDIDLIYSTMFGLAWVDPETEQLRTDFLSKVGPESARLPWSGSGGALVSSVPLRRSRATRL